MCPPFLLVASPLTGDISSGEESRLRGAGLLEGFPQHLQAALGNEVVLIPLAYLALLSHSIAPSYSRSSMASW